MDFIKSARKIRGIFFAFLVWSCFISDVSAQVIDDILLNTTADGKVAAIIKLSGQVQYLRHFPEQHGQYLEIYLKLLGDPAIDPLQGYEARKSPPSDLIPSFTVSVRDLTTEPKLVVEFSRPAEYSVRIGLNQRSFVITIQPDKAQAPANISSAIVATPVPAVSAPSQASQSPETDNQAAPLMTMGLEAMKSIQYGVAIDSFNRVLQLPPNKYSQDAQELIGVAREKVGQKFKAQLEYEAYLKMYSTGDGVARVKELLAKLLSVQPAQVTSPATGQPVPSTQDVSIVKRGFDTTVNGGLSMYYYHGSSLTNVAGATNSATPITDQSMLLTNINASMRTRNERYDNRLVFQDTYTKNYLSNSGSELSPNRLSAAYYDFKDKENNLSSRIGRQSPAGGGVMGRFDGISAGYGFTPRWQATASTGQLSDYTTGSKPTFVSLGLGLTTNERWGGSVYAVNQSVGGISDRQAVGAEMRYFDTSKNAFATLDYDTSFKVLNIALLQGTLNGAPGTNYNFLVDHRKTPSISISNALIGSPSSMSTMLQNGFSQSDLKALAILRTADANSVQLGVTTQVKEKWQAGADISVSNTSGMPQSGTNIPGSLDGFVAATPSTGNNYSLNGRLIGNGVFSTRDVSVFSLGYTTSSSTKGETFLLTNHANITDKWAEDASLRLYWQTSYDFSTGNSTGTESIVSPTFRLSYQARSNLNLEVDGGIDLTNNNPTNGQSSKTTRKYFSLGGRWDF